MSEWDHVELNVLATLKPVDCIECCRFTGQRQSAQRIELADEGDAHGMIVQIITAHICLLESQKMPVEAANDGYKVDCILDGYGIAGGSLHGLILAVGKSGSGHVLSAAAK